MKKAQKRVIGSLVAAASVAAVVAPAASVMAAGQVDVNFLSAKIDETKQTKRFGNYNEAYGMILQLPADQQPQWLAKLAPLANDVYTSLNLSYIEKLNNFAKAANLKDYEALVADIKANVSDPVDQGYFLGEITGWGQKFVYTPEVLNSIAAIGKVWTEKTPEAVQAAKDAVAKVANAKSVEWLNEQLTPAVEAAKVKVASVSAINNTIVQVTGIPATIKEADLAAKKITLTSGDVTVTGAYVLASLTSEGKANFLLDGSKKLTDAQTYTVVSDWATFTKNTFLAKVATVYTNTFDKVTTDIAAGTPALYFTAKNQYNEVINSASLTNVKTTITVNGMPLVVTADYTIGTSNEKVIINSVKTLKENDVVSVKFDTYDKLPTATDAKVIATSSATYTVVKAATTGAVPTTITSVTGVYGTGNTLPSHKVGDSAAEVLPTDIVTLTADVRDQYNNPVTTATTGNLVRWVVSSGKDCLSADITGDTTTNKVTFTAAKAGTVTVDAYNLVNGTKATYTITIGASKLASLSIAPEATITSTSYNLEDIIAQRISANSGAVLTSDMVKFNVVSKTTGVTASDVTITTSVRDKDDTTDSSKKKGDILITVNSAKSGQFEITPYVGTSFTDTNAITANMFTVTTTANPVVTSIDSIVVPSLKVGTPVKVGVVARNTHGEAVTLASSAIDVKVYKSGAVSTGVTPSQLDDKGVVTTTNVKQLGLSASAAGNYVVRVSLLGSTTFYDIPVVAEKTTLTSINPGVDITSGVIAGMINGANADPVYRVVDVRDNKGDLIIPDLGSSANQLSATVAKQSGDADTFNLPTVGLVYYKTVDGKLTETTKTDAEGVALKIDANAATTPVNIDKNVAVTITNNGSSTDGTLVTGSLNVIVKQARVLKALDVKETSLQIGLNGVASVDVSTKDQYGNFFTVNPTTELTFVSSDATIADRSSYAGMVDVAGKATTDVTKAVAYRFNVTGIKSGSVNLDVKYGTTLKDTVSVNVSPAASLVSSLTLTNSKLNADGTYKYKVENNNATAATFGITALGASGNTVAVDPADVIWTTSDASVATVVGGVVSTKAVTADKTVTITASVGTVSKSVTFTVSKDVLTMEKGTAKVAAAGSITDLAKIDSDATKAGIQISLDGTKTDGEASDGTITLSFKGVDQTGENIVITEANTPVSLVSFNSEVAKVSAWDGSTDTLKISAMAIGTTTIRVTIGTQDILLDVSVTNVGVATVAVAKAETTSAQADKDAAQALVTALSDGTVKSALQARINAVTVTP